MAIFIFILTAIHINPD